ncbi:MAG: Bax inhibitor-1 family protein [Burkholderiaceae bacterium]|jgi:FtsH-binding integral membrane protein|nr:Bax inhibitor-1 family protein [Burkholderiaceae bacterium]
MSSQPELVRAGSPSAEPPAISRGDFIKATYSHLAIAVLGFAALSTLFMSSGLSMAMLAALGKSQFIWLAVLGAFMLVGWYATSLADKATTYKSQLLGLVIYVLAESLIFAPMLALASRVAPSAIGSAAVVTLALVGGLTFTAFTSKSDFSFLGGILKIGGFVALGLIVAAILFGFNLGVWFSGAMILFAAGAVLYDTAQIIHHYPTDRPAGAALHLFASIALLFWYVLRLLMQLANDR